MQFKRRPFILIMGLLLFTAACQSATFDAAPEGMALNPKETLEPEEKQDDRLKAEPFQADPPAGWGKAHQPFVMSLYEQVVQQQAEDENIFISPFSIAMALAMAYNGAEDETYSAMRDALKWNDFSEDEINAYFRTLLEGTGQAGDGVEAEIANSMWIRQGVPIRESFIERMQTWYHAEVHELDFNEESAAERINRWVQEKTKDTIDRIVEGPLDADTILFLINAIYFKGDWKKPFDPDETHEDTFYGVNGEYHHPFMVNRGRFLYREDKRSQMVALPYGDGRYSMIVLLPKPGHTWHDLHGLFTPEAWEKWMEELAVRPGTIELPKFRLEYDLDLNEVLDALGMGVIFDENQARFSRMVDLAIGQGKNAYIKKVRHKTFIDVHEEGTEASAVTSIEAGATAASPPEEPFAMKVDRPFMIVIMDNRTDTFWFVGSIGAPKL